MGTLSDLEKDRLARRVALARVRVQRMYAANGTLANTFTRGEVEDAQDALYQREIEREQRDPSKNGEAPNP